MSPTRAPVGPKCKSARCGAVFPAVPSYPAGFGAKAVTDLYLRFVPRPLKQSGASTFHAQAYIPTQPAQAIEEAWISLAHEDPGRPEGTFPPPRQGAQAGLSKTGLPRIAEIIAAGRRSVSRESQQESSSLRPPVCLENRSNVSSRERERLFRVQGGFCVTPISSACTSRDSGIFRRR